jgi:hypothetical protein
MVKILGRGTLASGQKYVMIEKVDFENLRQADLLLGYLKKEYGWDSSEIMREVYREKAEEVPQEFKHFVERNPMAEKYYREFYGKGRPSVLTEPQRAFIEQNKEKTGKELYEHLRAYMGYTGSLKTVQNELGKVRDPLNQVFDLF